MRIIGGSFRGRHFDPGSKFTARPTTDFAKENLFNILASRLDFETMHVLDLFSGTGSISLEFVSRGAPLVHAIESDHRHAAFIRKNIETLQIPDRMRVVKINAFQFIKTATHAYDVIFADPPFDMKEAEALPDLILSSCLLAPDGVFILEHGRTKEYLLHPNLVDAREYGSVRFSFFKKLE